MSIPVNIIGYIHICQTGQWKSISEAKFGKSLNTTL